MVFCSKCGFENPDNSEKCEKCDEFLVKSKHFKLKKYDDFKSIFTNENYRALDTLTIEGYATVIDNIIEMGHHHLREYYENANINRRQMTTLDKIKALAEAYAKISYKASGAELGSYSFNSIRIDDRLDDANQIATLIHELSHHLFSEIFEQIMMYLWGCEKSDAIEALAWFTLMGNPMIHLTNEYCAHTCEGRFIPHGYQNYGSFNSVLTQEFDPEKDQKPISLGLIMGNTIAEDIINILEEFIDYDLRQEIMQQFKRDFTFPPRYDQIMLETNVRMPEDEKIASVTTIMKAGYDAAKNRDMEEILDDFKTRFSQMNRTL